MPRLDQDDMQEFNIAGKGGFAFTGARFDRLGASTYTLVTFAIDGSSSVIPYRGEIIKMVKMAVGACRKNPMSDNIMVRAIVFTTRADKGVIEIHGFKPLADIDETVYDSIKIGGGTPLIDGCYSGVGATLTYAEELAKNDYGANGILFTFSDGAELDSTMTEAALKKALEQAVTSEKLESLISILVGINTDQYDATLQAFQQKTGMTHYRKAGDATERNLAKLAAFVSQSVSSQALAQGTGGPSQAIAAAI